MRLEELPSYRAALIDAGRGHLLADAPHGPGRQFDTHEQTHGSRCCCFGVRCDLIGDLSGSRVIIEVKTGKVLQPTVRLQVTAQWLALIGTPHEAHDTYALQLAEDGTYKLSDLGRDEAMVLAAARIAQWRLRHDKKAKLSDDGPHALYREDGVRVPGISTVLKLAGLTDLSGIPAGILETARAKGEAVHLCLQYLVEQDLDAASIPEALRGYLAAYWTFCEREQFIATATEVPAVYDCAR